MAAIKIVWKRAVEGWVRLTLYNDSGEIINEVSVDEKSTVTQAYNYLVENNFVAKGTFTSNEGDLPEKA